MDIIIMGLGAVGLELAESLSGKNGINVAVVDTNPKKVEDAVNKFDVLGVVGNGVTFDALKEAGIDKTEILIATTSQDELNILCCIMGKKFGAKTTIARISESEYFKLIDGENGAYGLYIKLVNGIEADYDKDGTYWAFYKNGEMMMVGVDGAVIADGEHYELIKE